jgi:hypothetical protein
LWDGSGIDMGIVDAVTPKEGFIKIETVLKDKHHPRVFIKQLKEFTEDIETLNHDLLGIE